MCEASLTVTLHVCFVFPLPKTGHAAGDEWTLPSQRGAPLPFDGFGTLEVDLLCPDARVAIELDGGQHLADPVAYRRDRRKDQLLQENGYFVLRFLAEDVGKELDAVLDAILRVLIRRRQSAVKAEPLKFVLRGAE